MDKIIKYIQLGVPVIALLASSVYHLIRSEYQIFGYCLLSLVFAVAIIGCDYLLNRKDELITRYEILTDGQISQLVSMSKQILILNEKLEKPDYETDKSSNKTLRN